MNDSKYIRCQTTQQLCKFGDCAALHTIIVTIFTQEQIKMSVEQLRREISFSIFLIDLFLITHLKLIWHFHRRKIKKAIYGG